VRIVAVGVPVWEIFVIDIVSHSWLDGRTDSRRNLMAEMSDGVRGAIAQARLALANAEQKPKKRRTDVPEDDAFTREQIVEARS